MDRQWKLHSELTEHGLFLRPLGDTVYFVPPLVIDESELALAFQALEKALRGSSK